MAIVSVEEQKQEKVDSLPVITLRDAVVFPGALTPLTIGRSRVKAAVDQSWSTDKHIIVVSQKNPRIETPTPDDLYQIGTVCAIRRLWKVDGDYHCAVEGISRVYLGEFIQFDPFILVKYQEIPQISEKSEETEALVRNILAKVKRFTELGGTLILESAMPIFSTDDPNQLVNRVAHAIDIKTSDKQDILETISTKERLEKLIAIVAREIKILELSAKIDTETQERVSEMTKRAYLQEKRRSIEKELGEDDETRELSEYRKKIKEAGMPDEVREKAEKELSRLAKMSAYNPEAGYIRNYLDVFVELPWSQKSPNNTNLKKAGEILDQDHYGLKKVKERILEYLAVHKLVGKIKGPILCFVGPPGTGKTSVGKSIARALGRKFVRVSLGGIHDEAEIRGHRRTYVGALPGRIIGGIRNAATRNPVFMLDEIDKVGVDFRGDPSSALLEALDPEQNNAFSDHYLEVPFDLSDVMFITTANILDTIPPALLDRMEVILFPGYTEDEKFHIAKQFLLPKQKQAHGIKNGKAELSDGAVHEIINRYTREAGVRDLERETAAVFRKTAKKIVEGKLKKAKIGPADLQKFLGPAKFSHYLAEEKDEIGLAIGLAVTQAGGEIIFVEVTIMSGKGQLILTGKLGDVMKESAQAAMSYVRSRAAVLGLAERFAQKIDVHIHVPEGAVPKDGPSAGITMTTALVSALTKIPARKEVGMTGEVTLRGRVLEIGGVKEKVLAAHRAGLRIVILPADNKKDLEELPKNVKRDLEFIFVKHMDEVLEIALSKKIKPQKEISEIKKPDAPVFAAN